MGSGNSRLGSSSFKRKIMSSVLCGARSSSSRTSPEVAGVSNQLLLNSAGQNSLVRNEVQVPEVSPTMTSEIGACDEIGSYTRQHAASNEFPFDKHGQRVVENSDMGKCLYETRESIPPPQVSCDYSRNKSYRASGTGLDSTYLKEQQSSATDSVNASTNKNAVIGVDSSVSKDVSQNFPEGTHPSTSIFQGSQNSGSEGTSTNNNHSETSAVQNPNPDSSPDISGLEVSLQLPGNRSSRRMLPSHLGLIVSDRDSGRGDGGVLHVDMVSISSNILPGSVSDSGNREARRNSRRLFWDSFSRRSSRRFMDSPPHVNVADDFDDLGSHDRWLLDFDHDLFHNETPGDSGYLGSRMHSLSERRRNARSEIWGRLRGSLNGSTQQTYCPTGLHPDGTCSCESFLMTGESSASSSISRIVMLAEALFEVLDEIHRQPGSLSLSMVSRPAPKSVVDSLPLRTHRKGNAEESGNEDVAQCYICLADYEEGDEIRVLPCNHEFHMSCVDRWLKEIHGVCPLCRGEIREEVLNSSISPEINSA